MSKKQNKKQTLSQIPCKNCGKLTPYIHTQICDDCWKTCLEQGTDFSLLESAIAKDAYINNKKGVII